MLALVTNTPRFQGVKDLECTHIRCAKCATYFCYVCGVEDKHLDKANPSGSIFSHNDDWDINPKRCPLQLSQISELDDTWSEDEKSCIARISRVHTIKLLRDAVLKMGLPTFRRIRKKYGAVRNCGFSEEEILKEDLTLIKRSVEVAAGEDE